MSDATGSPMTPTPPSPSAAGSTPPLPAASVTAPPRRRRRLRRLGIFLGVLLFMLAGLTWFAPLIVARTELRNRVLRDVFSDLRGTPTARAASLSWFGPVELSEVIIVDAAGRPALTAARVTSSRSLFDLLTKRDNLGAFTFEQPRLDVIFENGSTNIEQVIAEYLTDSGKPRRPHRLGVMIEVKDGQVRLIEGEDTRTLDAFELNLTVPPPREEPVKLTASASAKSEADAPGKLAIDCQFLAGGKMQVSAENFAVGHVAPLVKYLAPAGTTAEGTLGGNVALTWGAAGETSSKFEIDGWASARNVRAAGPSWLGSDVLRLAKVDAGQAEKPVKLALLDRVLSIDRADITCDIGSASASGVFDLSSNLDSLLGKSGLSVKAEVDVARLGTLMPRLLRVKEGTEFRQGRVALDLSSSDGPQGPTWRGKLDSTALEAVRDGKKLRWEQPLKVTFLGRLTAQKQPIFDDLTLQSDFVGLRARGEPTDFSAAADFDLGNLSAHLSDFVDLSGLSFQGRAHVEIFTKPRATAATAPSVDSVTVDAKADFTNLTILDGKKTTLQETKLTVTVSTDIALDNSSGVIRIDTGRASLRSGEDLFEATLREPIADLSTARTGRGEVLLVGDLERWRKRATLFGGLPPHWVIRGGSTVRAEVAFTAEAITSNKIDVKVKNAVMTGAGFALDEPDLVLTGQMRYDRKSRVLVITEATLSCLTVGASAPRIDLTPTTNGEYGLATTMKATINLGRLQRTLGLQTDPTGADAISGKATGTLTLDASQVNILVFQTKDLRIENMTVGPEKSPTWREPWIDIQADGTWDTRAESLALRQLRVSRDGLSVDGKGKLGRLNSDVSLDVEGNATYDLAKLDTTLKAYLGKSAEAVGKDTKPFHISGNLASGGKNLAVTVGQPAGSNRLAALRGDAAVGWQSLKAYGFDVGSAEVRGTIDKGVVALTPIEATFGGGKARLEPTLALNPGAYDLSLARGKIIDKARLSPTVLSEALGYALPTIANAAQADGLISFELDESRIPLAAPERGQLKGTLTIHEASASAGPIVGELIKLLGVKDTSVKLVNDVKVPIELKDGRVHHRQFAITIDTVTIRTSGSVGLDGSLDMVVEVPLSEKIVGALPLLKDRPRVKEALAKQTISINVGGQVSKPRLDSQAFRTALNKVVEGTMRDAARGAVDDLLKDKLDKLPFPFFPKK